MITSDGKLLVFENFTIDHTLPKYQPKPKPRPRVQQDVQKGEPYRSIDSEEQDEKMSEDDSPRMSRNVMDTNMALNRVTNWSTTPNVIFTTGINTTGVGVQMVPWTQSVQLVQAPPQAKAPEKTWLQKLAFWQKPPPPPPMPAPAPPPEPEPLLTVEEFFDSVKHNAAELVIVKERALGYEKALLNAKRAGQQALLEKLTAGLNAYRMETTLVSLGLPRYVTEDQLVKFYKMCKKGLRLDYIRNFTRIIPDAIVAKKVRADELGIFDQYAILHYDPEAKSFEETEAEKARRKDPILFGLMQGRRTLYVVGDWVDEVCNLTLDQVADVIGQEGIGTITDALPTV